VTISSTNEAERILGIEAAPGGDALPGFSLPVKVLFGQAERRYSSPRSRTPSSWPWAS
jgi:hypothetical protein